MIEMNRNAIVGLGSLFLFIFIGFGCGESPGLYVDDSQNKPFLAIDSMNPIVSKSENFFMLDDGYDYEKTIGTRWVYLHRIKGCSAYDCYYSFSTDSIALYSIDTAIRLVGRGPGLTAAPLSDSFVSAGINIGYFINEPKKIAQSKVVLLDDNGRRIYIYNDGSRFAISYDPYGYIYIKEGYMEAVRVLTHYNGEKFDYVQKINVARGINNRYIEYLKSRDFVLRIVDTIRVASVDLNGVRLWSKGDSLTMSFSQPKLDTQNVFKVKGRFTMSGDSFDIDIPFVNRILDTALATGANVILRNRSIPQSF